VDLADARQEVADALTLIEELRIRPRGVVKAPRIGDGWVTVGRIAPADYTRCSVTLVVIIVLGADESVADETYESLAVDIIDATTRMIELPVADVALEPITLIVDGGGALHALTLTLTTEVED